LDNSSIAVAVTPTKVGAQSYDVLGPGIRRDDGRYPS